MAARAMRRLATTGLVIVATSTAASAGPEDDAMVHVRRGAALYERGELDAAIVELEVANRIAKTSEGCYALGQTLRRKSGNCEEAIAYYRCAVDLAPNEEVKFKANYQIGRCVVEGGLAKEPAPTPPPVVIRTETPETQPPWYRDTAGGVLLGLGLASAGIGGGFHLHAELRARSAGDDLESFRDADSVGSERVVGTVLVSVGGALIVGSIVRYVIAAQR